jgi:hypothetical protein
MKNLWLGWRKHVGKIKHPTLTEEEELDELLVEQAYRLMVKIAIRVAKKRRLAESTQAENN